MERDRLIQDGFAKSGNRVLTFESDENFSRAVGAMVELIKPGNGRISLESVLLERGIKFEAREALVSNPFV